MTSETRALPIAIAVALLSVAALASIGIGGWPGETRGCRETMRPTCFCERPRDGFIAQPANTLSNFGFVAAGLAIAFISDRPTRARRRNLLTSDRRFAILFSVVTVLLGPGSMAMHGAETRWGGFLDVSSMFLFASLLIAYGAARLRHLPVQTFAGIFVSLFTVLTVALATVGLPVNALFGALIATALGLELALGRRRSPQSTVRRGFAVAAVLSFLAAFAIWVPSLSGGPWCDPESWLQGHAIWHLLCATATLLIFLYYDSEDSEDAASQASS